MNQALPVKYFDRNSRGRDFVVGDIHGCYDLVISFMDSVGFDPTADRLFSVGDLIDRGPDSVNCLSLLHEEWFHPVYGNHEELMCDTITRNDQWARRVWEQNGGEWAYERSVVSDKTFVDTYIPILTTLPYVNVIGTGTDRINIVHAELAHANDDDVDSWNSDPDHFKSNVSAHLIWGRTILSGSRLNPPDAYTKYPSLTIAGHTIIDSAMYVGYINHLFIDTGAMRDHWVARNLADRPRPSFLSIADVTDKYNITIHEVEYGTLKHCTRPIKIT